MITTNKDIILIIGPAPKAYREWVKMQKESGDTRRYYNLQSKKQKRSVIDTCKQDLDLVIQCVFSDPDSIRKAIKPFENDILVATCRSEAKMWYFSNTIPHIPYLRTPTSKSLEWSVDKISMRRRFKAFDKSITPKFLVLKDDKKKTIEKIEKNVGYPCVVKPSGLASSMLVTVCYHQEELENALKKVFRKVGILNRIYKEYQDVSKPTVLVEEFMEGDLYSMDGVVSSRGKKYFYPPVYVKTGEKVGYDDFFGYLQMTPTKLKKDSIKGMEDVVSKAVNALGLRATTFHAELLRTEDGWKMVEIGPRMGGFRHDLYKMSYGIDATENDIAIRIPAKPIIPKKELGYSAAMKIYPRKEGRIQAIKGLRKVQTLDSVKEFSQIKKKGDRAVFARNGGKSICNIILFNEERSKLLADIRRIEKELIIEI